MAMLVDLLHLIAALALSLVGLGYEREEECEPVRFQPAAHVEYADLEYAGFEYAGGGAAYAPAELHAIDNCQSRTASTRLPVL